MSKEAAASFVANAQTSVVFGRSLTSGELDQINTVKETALNAGRQCSPFVNGPNGESITYFASIDDANSYVAVVNGFTPAPAVLATATSI